MQKVYSQFKIRVEKNTLYNYRTISDDSNNKGD